MSPVKVTITYCAECGYEPQTLDLAKVLMYEFGDKLSSIELIPWDSGTFDVSVDGELVHSMTRGGGMERPQKAETDHSIRIDSDDEGQITLCHLEEPTEELVAHRPGTSARWMRSWRPPATTPA
jgi:selenoprotein W-related protein